MPSNNYEAIWTYLRLPITPNTVDDDQFGNIRHFLELCNARWKEAWRPGTMLTVDETMIGFTGTGLQH